ncbi:MAG: glycosyltransferase family 4 protein [Pseudomonadota bacterium]|nr:glycosyltransferase family 4 protein [Pseudomonadota bacterium]
MKLCFLAGANSIHSHRWIKYFAAVGHEVTWISLAASQFDDLPGVRYHEVIPASGMLGLARAVVQVRKIVAATRADILHVHSVGTYGLVGLLTGFSPMVATPWGSDVIYGKESRLKRPFIACALRQAALVTCDAWHMRDEVMRFGVPAERIHIVNFGIDSQRFSPRGPAPAIREKLRLGEAPVIISLRNFDPVYDLPTLLRAVPLVLAVNPAARFVIVGRGPLEAELKALAEELGVTSQVRFVGFIPNAELPDYLSAMDIYVSTSLSDAGIAASTAEAMACGLPVVVTDSGENARWVGDGDNGFLVPVSQPQALAEKLLRLLADSGLRERMGQAGRMTIQERNDYQVEMAKMDTLYRQLGKKS